ncbi:MAG: hypothetical protein F2732_00210 [Actinobacteria bacterium]|uniref:Unannotated protein n=1 Tax=freshwater metagenome TaxID=449393 RepID=A0A6J6WDN1_9ZZZZ|nr:hypothetical protein [Actinomycetota bacterium]
MLNNLQEKLVGVVRTYFSGAARQSIPLILAIGFALTARFDSESLHQSTEIQLATVQGSSQKVDLTSFCPMLKYVNEGVSLHFKMSVPRDLNDYEIFSTSQSDGGLRFFLNEERQLYAVHKSSEFVLSGPVFEGEIDLDITVSLILDPLQGGRQRMLFMTGYPELQRTNAVMSVAEFNQINCDDQGLIGVSAKNSMTTITARKPISPALQEASRSTVLFRALVSLSLAFWLAIKWICRKQATDGNHGQTQTKRNG